jgi:6-pyruvoyl-tetrahydropterin synthase
MSTISVKMHFAAGHRILGLEGPGEKCRNAHGHTFYVTWTFAQHSSLEFGELKQRLRSMIKTHLDHGFILDKRDDFLHYLKANQLKHYALDGPPTTEAIAAEIAQLTIDRLTTPWKDHFGDNQPALFPNAVLLRVVLEEGPENCATWEPAEQSVDTWIDPFTYENAGKEQ